jgi:DNA-binding CsgD family transcriptional regulator
MQAYGLTMASDLEHARECYERRAWCDAYDALSCADHATQLEAKDLARLATAAYLSGRDAEFLRLHERLHRVLADASDRTGAARSAFWLALTFVIQGQTGQSSAWTSRGQRLIEEHDCVEQGYLLLPLAELQLRAGDVQTAQATLSRAAMIGERFAEADLTAAARHGQGRALIEHGDIPAGLRRLDETMLSVVAGELSPIMTGLMYCSVIMACRAVYALDRAREWTSAFSRVCEQEPGMVAFTGACLVHRSEIMQLQGEWPNALTEACLACERARRADRKPPGEALYQQAEIHRLRGEFSKSEDAYRAASELGCEPQPGLALLRLAQGRRDAACAAIRRLMGASSDALRRARLLPAYLEIMLAIGDAAEANLARDELAVLAKAFDADVLRAVVAQIDGEIAIVSGRTDAALEPLRVAFSLWQRLAAPYETARVRVLIGHACRLMGDTESAVLEHDAARAAFERLGAAPDLARLAARTMRENSETHPLTPRELHVLRLIATGRTNKEIAHELQLSERTIDRHVSNMLGKLDVQSRAAATAYAYDHELF